MGKTLSNQEMKAALEKLRSQYLEYGERYDRAIFNQDRFEERYLQALRSGLPLASFLAGEVATFQELKQMAEQKYRRLEQGGPGKADLLLQQFQARIRRYPESSFCARADEETRRLVGALAALEQRWGNLIPTVQVLTPGTQAATLAARCEPRVFALLVPRSGGGTRAAEDLARGLQRLSSDEATRNKMKQEFFKETGFLLHLLADLFTTMAAVSEVDMRTDGYRAAAQAVDEMIDDFRLREFRLAD